MRKLGTMSRSGGWEEHMYGPWYYTVEYDHGKMMTYLYMPFTGMFEDNCYRPSASIWYDPDPLPPGGFGFFTTGVGSSNCEKITVKSELSADLLEVTRSPNYRVNSHRFIIDLSDTPREDFQDEYQVGELSERIKLDKAYYIGLGREDSKASIQEFISKIDGQGKYIDNSHSEVYDLIADYMEPIVNKRILSQDKVYLLQNREYNFEE